MSHTRTSAEIDAYRWLVSLDGHELMSRIDDLAMSGASGLRISELLRADHPSDHVALAMTQRDLRHRAGAKFPDANRLFFTREGLEQATSSKIAAHRARRFADAQSIVDLCCGIGGDLMALASLKHDAQLAGVDLDPVHLLLAQKNVSTIAPKRQVDLFEMDVRDIDSARYDAVFIDPARRNETGRLGGIASDPPLDWAILLAQRVPKVGIKTAPGIPHALVPDGWELETIALDGDLKEAVLWSPALATSVRTATIIDHDNTHTLHSVPGLPVPLIAPEHGSWLIDPNPAITRAGLVQDLARTLDGAMIDPEIAFLIATHPTNTPFGRSLPIIDAIPWHEKKLKNRLRELDAGPIDIRRRGLAGDVNRITKRLRGKGDRPLTIAMTRVNNAPWAIICETMPPIR